MENVIHLVRDEHILRHVVLDEPVILVAGEMLDVGEIAGDEIVDGDHAMAFRQEPVGEVRAEKTAPPVTTETIACWNARAWSGLFKC